MKLPNCHQQRQTDSGMGAATAARQRLAPAAVVVVRWSKDINAIFYYVWVALYFL
jgi:hypothetical protein